MGGVFSTADLSWVLPVAVVGGLVLIIGIYVIWKKHDAPVPPSASEPGHSPKKKRRSIKPPSSKPKTIAEEPINEEEQALLAKEERLVIGKRPPKAVIRPPTLDLGNPSHSASTDDGLKSPSGVKDAAMEEGFSQTQPLDPSTPMADSDRSTSSMSTTLPASWAPSSSASSSPSQPYKPSPIRTAGGAKNEEVNVRSFLVRMGTGVKGHFVGKDHRITAITLSVKQGELCWSNHARGMFDKKVKGTIHIDNLVSIKVMPSSDVDQLSKEAADLAFLVLLTDKQEVELCFDDIPQRDFVYEGLLKVMNQKRPPRSPIRSPSRGSQHT